MLDLVMPGMDGTNVLAELAERRCTARIIITSGTGGHVLDAVGRTASARGLNVAAVLAKPFSATALRQVLLAKGTGPSQRTAQTGDGPGFVKGV
jgi:CheY-like chemotaxis protein